jgi:hypothetical protein
MTWRAVAGNMQSGAGIGAVVGVVGTMLQLSLPTCTALIFAAAGITGMVWRVVAVRMALLKNYSDFRLTLSHLP